MIDLKEVITKYPECLESAAKLKSYLADLYPEEKARCSILATIFDVGIAEQIKNGKVDNLSVDSYCNSLKDTYGYSPRLIRECIEIWSIAYKPALKMIDSNGLHQPSIEEPTKDFKVEDGVLIEHLGDDECIVVPQGTLDFDLNATVVSGKKRSKKKSIWILVLSILLAFTIIGLICLQNYST